jgi:hypothetical protein
VAHASRAFFCGGRLYEGSSLIRLGGPGTWAYSDTWALSLPTRRPLMYIMLTRIMHVTERMIAFVASATILPLSPAPLQLCCKSPDELSTLCAQS